MNLREERRLAVVGAGLIGSSVVAALRKAGAKWRFICVDRSASTRREAVRCGLFDEAFARCEAGAKGADCVLVAVPVLAFAQIIAELAPLLGDRTVVFDCGSCKALAVRCAKQALGDAARRFVPCHPIAGREFHGIGAADPDLFRGKNVIMTARDSAPGARRAVAAIWRGAGARVRSMDTQQHDEIFSAVSHLPHALAFALVDMVGHDPLSRPMLENAASGFQDFTRIASSSPEMWGDILIANRENILRAMDNYGRSMGELKRALRRGDRDALVRRFEYSKRLRNRWLRSLEQ